MVIKILTQEINKTLQKIEGILCERCGAKKAHTCSKGTKLGTFICGRSFEIQTQEIARKEFGAEKRERALKKRKELSNKIENAAAAKNFLFLIADGD